MNRKGVKKGFRRVQRAWVWLNSSPAEREVWQAEGKLTVSGSVAFVAKDIYKELLERAAKTVTARYQARREKKLPPEGYKSIGEWALAHKLSNELFFEVVDRALRKAEKGELGIPYQISKDVSTFLFTEKEFLQVLKEVSHVADDEKSR